MFRLGYIGRGVGVVAMIGDNPLAGRDTAFRQ